MDRSYYVVDAFTNERFAGNAAAVVLDAEGLGDGDMRSIAAEFNLSETTFVLPTDARGACVRFRWFTPTAEVAMCGHATIAGVHAMVESGKLRRSDPAPSDSIGIDTLSGVLSAFIEEVPGSRGERMIWLDLPTPVLSDYRIDEACLASVLGLASDSFEPDLPPARTQDDDVLVFVRNVGILNDARPDPRTLGELQEKEDMRGLCLATTRSLTPSIHVQSRFFAPAVGIDEDPVTGSVHGPLAAYLVRHNLAPTLDGTAGLMCVQGKAGGRTGLVYALARIEPDDTCAVRIGGRAVTAMRGVLVA